MNGAAEGRGRSGYFFVALAARLFAARALAAWAVPPHVVAAALAFAPFLAVLALAARPRAVVPQRLALFGAFFVAFVVLAAVLALAAVAVGADAAVASASWPATSPKSVVYVA